MFDDEDGETTVMWTITSWKSHAEKKKMMKMMVGRMSDQ